MSRLGVLATWLRLLGAVAALLLALAVFQEPLEKRLPPWFGEITSRLPGAGASRGFVVQVLSQPPGARVVIQGADRGTTPFFGNVACRSDAEVTIVVAAEGYAPWRRAVPCREGGTLEVKAQLGR